MANIEAMFHQVKVPEGDRDALRFLWWPDGKLDSAPATFRMTVHLFGGVWSPSCASYALRCTFQEFGSEFPEACLHMDAFYVDDLLTSVSSTQEATSLVEQLRNLVSKGGFKLNKWVSNRQEVLSMVAEGDRSTGLNDIELCREELPAERALGLIWDLVRDSF